MNLGSDRTPAGEDRDRILATLMEEWSPLQRDLLRRLLVNGDEPGGDPDSDAVRAISVMDNPAPSPGRRGP